MTDKQAKTITIVCIAIALISFVISLITLFKSYNYHFVR